MIDTSSNSLTFGVLGMCSALRRRLQVWPRNKAKPASLAKSRADKVNYFMVAVPGDEEYTDTVDWLEQFYPLKASMIRSDRRIVLVVGSSTYVEEIWTMRNNHYHGVCHLEWKLKEEEECE